MDFKASDSAIYRLPHHLLTALLLLMGFGVLVVGMDAMHMRPDEMLTFANMRYSFSESMTRLATRNNQAHLWWITIWVWQRIAGQSEFAMRLNAILTSMLTLAVVYQIGRSWFGKARYGWFSIMLLSANSYFFIYALEMRMYALAMLMAALSMRVFYGWLDRRNPQAAAWYSLSIAAMLYTHYYLAFVVLAQAAYFALFHLLNWKLIKQGLLAASIAVLVWLPGALILYNQLQFIRFASRGGLNIPTKPSNLATLSALAQVSTSGWLPLYALAAALGLSVLWRKAGYRLLLVWVILAPGLVLVVNTRAPIYTQRYTSFVSPAVALVAGVSLAALPLLWPRDSKCRPNERLAPAASWIVVLLLASMSLYRLPQQLPDRRPLRDIYGEMSALSPPDTTLYTTHIDVDGFETEHMRRYLARDVFANRVDTIDTAAESRYVWFVTNDWFDEEVRTQFDRLSQTHRVREVAGDCKPAWCYLAQLMAAPPRREPLVFGEELGFHGADIEVTDASIQALLWWSADTPPDRDYSISLQLLDSSGALVTQIDRQIMPPDGEREIPTSQLQPGGSYIDWRVLALPDDLRAGQYRLQLVVYRWQDNTRLTLPDGSDTLTLDTVTIVD